MLGFRLTIKGFRFTIDNFRFMTSDFEFPGLLRGEFTGGDWQDWTCLVLNVSFVCAKLTNSDLRLTVFDLRLAIGVLIVNHQS